MCISYCHKRNLLYLNHYDCDHYNCDFAADDKLTSCDDCTHAEGNTCRLTMNPLPLNRCCCHGNVPIPSNDETDLITLDKVRLIASPFDTSIADVLDDYDVPFRINDNGDIEIAINELALPKHYGYGAEH